MRQTHILTAADLPLDEVHALAYLVVQHRSRVADAQPWDRTAVAEQIARLHLTLPDALTVSLRAASDAAARTPAALQSGAYWSDVALVDRRAPRFICDHCGRTRPLCERAQLNTGTDRHPFRSRGESNATR